MRVTASLLSLYLRQPGLALSHAGKAMRLLAGGGPSQLRSRLALLSGALDAQTKRRRDAEQLARSLAGLQENARRNRDAIMAELLPHAQDLHLLDIVHDADARYTLVHGHLLGKFCLFDEAYYTSTYLQNVPGIRPLDHYMRYGVPNGLRPNPFFDPLHYLTNYPDVAEWGLDPVLHYTLFGWRENRVPGAGFDAEFYLQANPDVARAGISPFHHFLAYGRHEGRLPTRQAQQRAEGVARDAGTIVLVSHDAELGGAQQVLRVFARWLLASTKYEVKLVTMRGGPFFSTFQEIGESLDVSGFPAGLSDEEIGDRLRAFAGPDVKAVFLNSAVSGDFLRYWRDETPVVAFIHELPKLLKTIPDAVSLLRERATTVVGGSGAVRTALRDQFEFDDGRMQVVHGFIEAMPETDLVDPDGKRAAKQALGMNVDDMLVVGCGVLHWRKSPDKFVEVAQKVVAAHGASARFVWIGGGPDQAACEKLVAAKGLSANVVFTGYEPDIMRHLNAADLFLLPSEEDPFPLVCLYAGMALMPIVCFEKAGGIPELVAHGCGRAVPFGDVDAMAAAVLDYLRDPALREAEGRVAREVVAAEHTVRAAGPQLLHHIRQAAGLKPHVSVVVPNYNYERFLPERLQSILDQTFQDFELILLDDVSKDGSVAILEDCARRRPGTRVVVNEKNSGSPFAQWLRGMDMAKSDLIWMAEADDACAPDLLATLLPALEDRNVFMAYVKSVPIGTEGQVYGDYEDIYLNRISEGRWSQPYLATDHEEAQSGLGIANCIPNASSLVFRRFEIEPDFAETLKGMRLCGDWYFYVRAMRGGMVAYSNRPLNLHRRHAETVTKTTEGSSRYFSEFGTVRDYIRAHYRQGEATRAVIERFTTEDLDRFGVTDEAARTAILAQAAAPHEARPMPTVMVVVSDLSPGGGQMFGIRLANGWARRGGRAILVNARHFPDHPQVVSQVDPAVALFHADGLPMSVPELVARFDVDVVHSSIWWADRFVQDHIDALPGLPWIVTMHGCHETMLDNPQIDLSFPERFKAMLGRVQAWVPTAEKNKRVFKRHGEPARQTRIANGIEAKLATPLPRKQIGVREDALLLCIASRAIAEKGWFDAVEMTKRLNALGVPADLILLGEGPAATAIAEQAPEHVHLLGHRGNVLDYLATADVGLLPSFFPGESMPLVLTEMLAQALPVVASNAGDIGLMLGEGPDAGGTVVPLQSGKINVDGFVEAIKKLADPVEREAASRRARACYEREFTMDGMIEAYRDLYRSGDS
jgi:glycosyltransferase involved in cell wall biosynthesis